MLPPVNADRTPDVGKDWLDRLANGPEGHLTALLHAVDEEYRRGPVHPAKADVFRAFRLTPFDRTRVVLLGQDPYHGPGQAHGLSFSVPPGVAFPPSLRNVFKELQRDLGVQPPLFGDLHPWAEQGVLLLNTCLTVRQGEAGSHQRLGWERFTDQVISVLSTSGRRGIVFLLWGNHAASKAGLIDRSKHHVLTAPHPSPLSAHRGFIGCGHFSRTNALLQAQGDEPINWQLP
jgi:uracil-DNA glycosylase